MAVAQVAVVGGSGFYQMEGVTDVEEVSLTTPFGDPSDSIFVGTLAGVRVAFLPRHGRGHRLSPSEVNSRANVYALKSLGVERIISVSAVGSLREEIRPLDVVVPDQLFDRTKARPSSFFSEGLVVHVGFADPFCPDLSGSLVAAAREVVGEAAGERGQQGSRVHVGGTYVCIEGPQFSTRAESRIYRQLDCDVIGMTALPEAKLAREAEICYATLALATDYDVWRVSEEPVSVEMVVQNLQRNVQTAKQIVRVAVGRVAAARSCDCSSALASAMITQRDQVADLTWRKLGVLVAKYA